MRSSVLTVPRPLKIVRLFLVNVMALRLKLAAIFCISLLATILPVNSAPPKELPPDIASLASELKVLHLIEKIRTVQSKIADKPTLEEAIELLTLRQRLDYRLTVTSLEIEKTLSDIDKEDTRADELRFLLENRRQKALQLNSYANLIGGGGLSIIGAGLGVGNNTVGNIVQTTGGSVNASLAAAALNSQRDTGVAITHRGTHRNMLAVIFGLPLDEDTAVPATITAYLNEPVAEGSQLTRKDELVRRWTTLGRIPSRSESGYTREVNLIAGEVPESHRLTISVLDDRSAMLSDLRAEISNMNSKLLKLMLSLGPDE
jgi:hypothetical protein